MRSLAFVLFGLAAALAIAAIWIHLTDLRSVEAATIGPETIRKFVSVQVLGQTSGGVLVLGLILLFGRRDPTQTPVAPAENTAPRGGPRVLFAVGGVLVVLLPLLAAGLLRLFRSLFETTARTDELTYALDVLDATFWPTVIMATLPGLVLIAIGIAKLQRPARPAFKPQSAAADLGTGGPWIMILTAIGVGVGTPLALRGQLEQLDALAPGAAIDPTLQGIFRVIGGVAIVFAVILFLFGVGLLRRVMRDRSAR